MNVNPEAPQATDLPADPLANAAPESMPQSTTETLPPDADKPVVRRKRAAKAAVATAVDGATGDEALHTVVEPDGPAADSAADAPTAKPPRRKRAAATPVEAPIPPAAPPARTAAPAVGADLALAGDGSATSTAVDGDGIPGEALPLTATGAAEPAERDAATGEAPQPTPHSRRRERRDRRPVGGQVVDAVQHDAASGDGVAAPSERLLGGEPAGSEDPMDMADEDGAADLTETAAEPPADVGEVFAQVLSGTFDVDAEPPADGSPALPPKRVLRAEPEAPKLHKVLAQAGVGSRRDMEELILDGHITVNGQPAHIGQRISFGDQIKVKGKPVRFRITPLPARVIAYHKPVGEVVTHDDPQARPTVFRRLPRLQQGKWQSVGRLDINTEGLLLFTNSGELANRLMHPRFGVEREYAVRVLGTLDAEDKAQLMEGVGVDGQTASFRSIEDGGGEGANHWYRVVITEGRNREVRKLFDAVDLTVSRLIRIRYGCVVLPRGLKRGVWVDLDDADVRMIRQLAAVPGDRNGEGGDVREARQDPRPEQRGRQKNKPDRQLPRNAASNAGGPGDVRRNDRGPSNGNPGNGGRPNGGPAREGGGNRVENRADEHGGERSDLDIDDDFDPSRIPNPLEQTFDKRFVQNPRTPAGGRGFRNGGGGFGAGGSAPVPANPKRGDGPRQPDPMQTSVGYIGGDAFHRKGGNRNGGGSGGGGGGGNRGGSSGGGNGGNRGGFGGQGGAGGGNRRGR